MEKVDPKESKFWLQTHNLIVIGMPSDAEGPAHILLEPQWSTEVPDKPGYKMLTLEEIAAQFPEVHCLTVIAEAPLEGYIYRYNNYGNREWLKIGTTCGYA